MRKPKNRKYKIMTIYFMKYYVFGIMLRNIEGDKYEDFLFHGYKFLTQHNTKSRRFSIC